MDIPLLIVVAVLSAGIPLVQADSSDWSAKLSVANQLFASRQFPEAIVAAEESLEMAEKRFGREAPELIEILGFLGTVYSTKAAFDEKPSLNKRAIAYLRREVSILRRQTRWSAKQQLEASLYGLGQACQSVHNLSCAVQSYRELIATTEPLESSLADVLLTLARIEGKRKDFESAEALMHRYLALRERAPDHCYLDYEVAAEEFANWHNDREAESLYGLAISESKAQETADHDPNVAYLLGRAASFYTSLGQYGQAGSLLDEALVILRTAGEVQGSAQIYAGKATICKLLGDRPAAVRFIDQANEALKALPPGIVIEPYTYAALPGKPRLARYAR